MNRQPFTIHVSDDVLDDLRTRLARTRWPDQVEGAGWDYGVNLDYIRSLTDYWLNGFDWRAQEARLNDFAHFRTAIDGTTIHYIHERGRGPNPQPLLLLHGWPSTFDLYHKLIPLLTDPARFGGDPANAFDVVVPSLTGFGFSDRPTRRGGNRDAELLPNLMQQVLGYDDFGVHAGDTGGSVAQAMAMARPDALCGLHLTDIGWNESVDSRTPGLTPAQRAYYESLDRWMFNEGAYISLQGTKPQNLAYGLNDSPVALAAWIIDQFRKLSDCQGDIERSFSRDELLTNVTLYWVTETINSSMRWYYDGLHADWGAAEGGSEWSAGGTANEAETGGWGAPSPVPVGMALFPANNPPPREVAERYLNIVHWSELPRGGHFAALEVPELLAADLCSFFGSLP